MAREKRDGAGLVARYPAAEWQLTAKSQGNLSRAQPRTRNFRVLQPEFDFEILPENNMECVRAGVRTGVCTGEWAGGRAGELVPACK